MDLLEISVIQEKIAALDSSVQSALVQPKASIVPETPGRDAAILHEASERLSARSPEAEAGPLSCGQSSFLAPAGGAESRRLLCDQRPKFSEPEGLRSLIHALANIELQAVELNLRTLHEFPNAPLEFREQLAELTKEEGGHLQLCLKTLRDLGGEWGESPVSLQLWRAIDPQESLPERVLRVHCYLEGAGLDSGDALLRRLSGLGDTPVRRVVHKIVSDEIRHVSFGLKWLRALCTRENIQSEELFRMQIPHLRQTVPRREQISINLRLQAGFRADELAAWQ